MIRRNIEHALEAAMADTPVVLVNGPRQAGKTTLVRAFTERIRHATYLTLDDAGMLAAAVHDPRGFVERGDGVTVIDEIQKAPQLLSAIKMSVDSDRRPGRFLLTGSADVLALPKVSESLVGRMEIITLRPFSQGEREGHVETFIDRVMQAGKWRCSGATENRVQLAERVSKGGYPEAVRRSSSRRRNWFASYLTTILQRDIRDLSNIEALSDAPRLMALLAARSGALLNISEVSRSIGIPHTTLQRYLALFEATFLLHRIRPWTANLGKRLVKSPKLLLGDTGFMTYLLNAEPVSMLDDPVLSGRFIETFVGCELMKQIEWSDSRPAMLHYRTSGGAEVDFVLEEGGRRVAGIEVKLARTVGAQDFRGLKSLAEDAKTGFVGGVVLYSGNECIPFGDRLWAVPFACLWS